MIGNTVSTRRSRLALNPVRVATSANARPKVVVVVPVKIASRSVFHPTPQLPPVRQSSRQIFAAKRRSASARPETAPSLPWIALNRIRATG